jgi:FKBP-type peptidyl-prolyl cis-trans isomerase
MHYTGSIAESSPTGVKGKVFDSSRNRGTPFDFVLGQGRVIQGWELGLMDMCKGEKRVLTIPADLGYGNSGAGADIPPGT